MSSYKKLIRACCGSIFKSIFPHLKSLSNIRIILMYHRVLRNPPNGLYDVGMYILEKSFEKNLNEITRYFNIVPLKEIINRKKSNKKLCAITFDDGWLDNYEIAFPLLKAYKTPATIFIPVDYIGTKRQFWFQSFWEIAQIAARGGYLNEIIDYLVSAVPSLGNQSRSTENLKDLMYRLKTISASELEKVISQVGNKFSMNLKTQRSIMNWEEISKMSQYEISFGSHGLSHYILPTLNFELKKKEVFDSFAKLRDKSVNIAPFFSYPNGEWDDESASLVVEAGYKGALTIKLGVNTPESDPFFLSRIAMHEDASSSVPLFWFRIFQAVLVRNKNIP